MKRLFFVLVMSFAFYLCSCSKGPDVAGTGGTSDQGNAFNGVTGRVFSPDNSPAFGAKVYLFERAGYSKFSPDAMAEPVDTTQTDRAGAFVFPKVEKGEYSIEIRDDSGNGLKIDFSHPGADSQVRLGPDTLCKLGAVTGQLLIQQPGDFKKYAFYVIAWEIGRYVFADDSGRFIMDSLPKGRYSLSFQSMSTEYVVSDTSGLSVPAKDTLKLGGISILKIGQSGLDTAFINDTLAVRAILDSNHVEVPVGEVTWVKAGRIVYFQYFGSFTVIPDQIGRLTSLEYFGVFSDNSINRTDFPISPEMGKLSGLKILELVMVNLAEIPPTVAQLSSLEELNLTGNKISVISPDIFGLPKLRALKLGSNLIDDIPSAIKNLTELKYLDLSDNHINTLCPEICTLRVLEKLYIGVNTLTSLPEEVGNLTTLQQLSVRNNKLSALPSSITGLNCVFDCSANTLCSLSVETNTWINAHFCNYLNCSTTVDWRASQQCK